MRQRLSQAQPHNKILGGFKKMKKIIKLANATMHDQSNFRDAFKNFGFDVEATPRLRQVTGAKEAYNLACEVVELARKGGFDGLLLGGRTDVMIYIAILAPIHGLDLYQAETVRVRDEHDRFVFNLAGVTKVYLSHPADLAGAAIVAEIDTAGIWSDRVAE
jgi:hypothetical protein